MKSNSSSKSKKSYIFEDFIIDQNENNFFNNYSEYLEDIFEILYKKLGKPPESTNLKLNSNTIQKLISNPINIDKYSLICKYSNEKIIFESTQKENWIVEIKYFSKIKIENYKNLKKVWIYNKQIPILLLTEAKYICTSKKEIKKENEYDLDGISLISNIESLQNAIKNDNIIHATKNDIINIETIGNWIDNNNNFSKISNPYHMSFFLEGPNSMNFPKIENSSEVKKILTSIDLEDSLKFPRNLVNFLYNKKIGMSTHYCLILIKKKNIILSLIIYNLILYFKN